MQRKQGYDCPDCDFHADTPVEISRHVGEHRPVVLTPQPTWLESQGIFVPPNSVRSS